ncbi:DUF3152 domain-containing protein [Mangrovihabitans endophyticus]|uniref:DUF3152 domain-containing protein n=1 Tax=Mangrovihabitans endophyticus TaxID=1751298 RepID=A0A8J3FP37_9ACTN|nr:DUF3152 domain-containing protein [Mangrovihabitans endophyticus]GGK96350.1 hypothetical protein GCM10012284_33240 [Mangrovihabitans endophyticus]
MQERKAESPQKAPPTVRPSAERPLIADPDRGRDSARRPGSYGSSGAAALRRPAHDSHPSVFKPPPGVTRPGPPPVDAPRVFPAADDRPIIGVPAGLAASAAESGGPMGSGPTSASAAVFRRRRVAVLLAFVLMTISVLVTGRVVNGSDTSRVRTVAPVASAAPSTAASAATPPTSASAAAQPGAAPTPGKFTFAAGRGPVLGFAGTIRRFRVAVEETVAAGPAGEDVTEFADEVDATLGDRRSWIASRDFRLQRVSESAASEFTVYLASAVTSQRMCASGGLDTERFTSCRLPGRVIINADRWRDAVPNYGAPLSVYRAYAVNHEVGHQLGHGHEACPGGGRTAPVMMQQTYGLRGCVANAWPYLDGKRYAGRRVA